MRALITGGAGFIGSHICERAIGLGWEVVAIDDLSTGHRDNVPSQAGFEQIDIRDRDGVLAVFRDFRPEVVSHQAAQASVAVSVREPRKDAEINIGGSLNVLDAAVETGVKRVVFASTGGAIYGEVPEGYRANLQTPENPLSPYAVSKLAVEKYLVAYRMAHQLDYTILRYANVYGPRQDPHGEAGVVAIFVNRMLDGTDLTINAKVTSGDRGCIRDYVFIDDVAAANVAAMKGEVHQRIINVCTGTATDTQTLAETLANAIGTNVEMKFGPLRAGDVERSVLDPHDLDNLLGVPVDLAQGLATTATYFKNRRTSS